MLADSPVLFAQWPPIFLIRTPLQQVSWPRLAVRIDSSTTRLNRLREGWMRTGGRCPSTQRRIERTPAKKHCAAQIVRSAWTHHSAIFIAAMSMPVLTISGDDNGGMVS